MKLLVVVLVTVFAARSADSQKRWLCGSVAQPPAPKGSCDDVKAFKEKGIKVFSEWNEWKSKKPRDSKKAEELRKQIEELLKELEKYKDTKDKDGKNCLEQLGYPYENAKKLLQNMLDSLKDQCDDVKTLKEKGVKVFNEWNEWKDKKDKEKAKELIKKVEELQKELEKFKDAKDKDGENCLEMSGYPYETAKMLLQNMLDSLEDQCSDAKAFKEKGVKVFSEWNECKSKKPRDNKKAEELMKQVEELQKELENHKDAKDKDGKNCLEQMGYPYGTAKKLLQNMLDSLKEK